MALPPPPPPAPGGPPPPGGMMPGMGAAPAPDDTGAPDTDDNVVCTVVSNGDGTYTVYAGDEPDQDTGDMSEDDANAMGAAGEAPGAQGQEADSVGAALKLVMDILKADATSQNGQGSAEQQFASGFGAPAGGGGGAGAGGPPGP